MCLSLQNKTKSVYGEDIKSITLVAPSIFPILYAAILGKMLRRVGLYKSERNARIGVGNHIFSISAYSKLNKADHYRP